MKLDPNPDVFEFLKSSPIIAEVFFLFILLLLLVSSSSFEAYIFSLTPTQISEFKRSKEDKIKKLCFLLKAPKQIIASLVVTRYASLSALILICELILQNLNLTNNVLHVILLMCIVFLLIFIFGEIIPGYIFGKAEGKQLPCIVFYTSYFMNYSLKPISKLLNKFTKIVDKRIEAKTQHFISLDELNETLKHSAEEAKQEEKDILQGIVNFGKISADEIMKPRVDIVDIDINSKFTEVIKIIRDSEYSRLPVYEGSIDNVKGILYIKDVIQYLDKGDNFCWKNLIRKAYFIPESKKIDDLMKEFQDKRIHMAIVVDEFGGTSGIVTLEDILEVIVGDICDEHDDEEHKLYSQINEKNYTIDAKLSLSDFYKIKGVDKEKFEEIETDADTVAGLILELSGDIPVQGEEIIFKEYKFKIISADNRRIKKLKLQIP